MMRPFSLLCMLLAIGSGLHLYRVKYGAQVLDREIHATLRAADETRARAAMLRADYALLNDPIRLQELVDLHLPLRTTQPVQFTTIAEMERRLPPVGLTPPEPRPEPEIPVAVIRPEPRAALAAVSRAAEPGPVEAPRTAPAAVATPLRPAQPPQIQAIAPPPLPRAVQPQAIAPAPTARPPVSLALPGPTTAPTPQPSPRPTPSAPAAQTASIALRAPPAAVAPPVAPASVARAAPQPVSEPPPVVVRSSLGMARRLAAPDSTATGPGGGGGN